MKNYFINRNIYDELLFLLENHKDNFMPPTDYINMIRCKMSIQEEDFESVVEMYLSLNQHKQLFSDFIDYFYCIGKRKDHSDKHFLMILSFILSGILNITNKDGIIDICKQEKCQKMVNFLRFFNKESVLERLFLIGCQYFDESYIKEKIMMNIKKNQELLQDIQGYFSDMLARQKAEYKREPTRPVTPRVTAVMRQSLPPPPPTNTPEEILLPPAKPVPPSTYRQSRISEELKKIREQNRFSSQLLLEEANEASNRLSAVSAHTHSCSTGTASAHTSQNSSTASAKPSKQSSSNQSEQKRKSKSLKPVIKNDIPVKKNAATILREAARLIRDEEKDIKRMNELVSGAADHASYEEMMDQLRAEEEQLKLQDIERKHLLGQLTREEAILARQRLLELNKAKRAQIEREKKETEELLKQMQLKQEEEIRRIIDKTQQIQKNIEANKQDLIHKKQMEAQEVAKTNKQLYAEAMMRQKQEMEKRMEIIKEIKALSSLKDLQGNKFDPTETMNVGLLCEMSLAELYDRLLLKRTSIQEEIENRQKCIRKQKLKQQQFLAETQQFIDECREQKKLLCEKKDATYKQLKSLKAESRDIVELRERLEKARQKRMELTKN